MRFSTCVCLALGALAATALSCASTGRPASDPNTRLAKLGVPVPRLVHIPAGSFTMGDDAGPPAERPAHRVTLSSFWMSEAEVTVDQFAAFVAATGFQTSAERSGQTQGGWIQDSESQKMVRKPDASWRNPYFPQEGDQPVVLVTLLDARAYTEWLARTSGLRVMLPTEAQWEHACKAGGGGPAWHAGNSGGRPRHAKNGAANALGLYDLAGNVWEWTREGYRDYTPEPARDPAGPEISERGHVMRGGSWNFPESMARCSFREEGHGREARAQDLGFRVVVEGI